MSGEVIVRIVIMVIFVLEQALIKGDLMNEATLFVMKSIVFLSHDWLMKNSCVQKDMPVDNYKWVWKELIHLQIIMGKECFCMMIHVLWRILLNNMKLWQWIMSSPSYQHGNHRWSIKQLSDNFFLFLLHHDKKKLHWHKDPVRSFFLFLYSFVCSILCMFDLFLMAIEHGLVKKGYLSVNDTVTAWKKHFRSFVIFW